MTLSTPLLRKAHRWLWLVTASAGLGSAHAETLQEAMSAAYNSSPTLAAQRAALRALDEDVATANAGYHPTLQTQAQITDTETPSINIPTFSANGINKSANETLTVPVFRGFRTVNGVKAAKLSVDAGRQQLKGTEIQLLLDTVSAYMNVVRDQSVLELNTNQVSVLQEQLRSSQDRFRVGELTRTDVAQSDARLASAISARIQAEGSLTASREAYRKAVGQEPGTLVPPPPLPPLPGTVEEAVDIAIKQAPTTVGARINEQVARKEIDVAKGALLPTLNGFAEVQYSSSPSRGFSPGLEVVQTIIGGNLSIPLYQGGSEYAAVRKAQQIRSQRALQIAEAERAITESTRNAWEGLRTARASIVSSQSAVKANEIALQGVKQEQTVGSRTTLDVLNAEQELLNSKVTLVRAQRDEYVSAFNLLAVMGSLGARELGLAVDVYDPDVNYKREKGRWIGWDAQK